MDYNKIYNEIIKKAKSENRRKNKEIYYERHHIIPRCLDGNNNSTNLVLLTAREHFISHWILHILYPTNNKLFRAFDLMCIANSINQNRYIPSSRIYEYLKVEKSKRMSGNNSIRYWLGKKRPDISGDNHPMRKNPDLRQILSDKAKNRKVSDETKKKLSESNKGRIPWNKNIKTGSLSISHKQKISEAHIGKLKGEMSMEHREKLRKIQLANSSSARKIVQKDINGNIIEIFSSVAEARRKTGVSRIFDALNGSKKIVNGFKWEYYG